MYDGHCFISVLLVAEGLQNCSTSPGEEGVGALIKLALTSGVLASVRTLDIACHSHFVSTRDCLSLQGGPFVFWSPCALLSRLLECCQNGQQYVLVHLAGTSSPCHLGLYPASQLDSKFNNSYHDMPFSRGPVKPPCPAILQQASAQGPRTSESSNDVLSCKLVKRWLIKILTLFPCLISLAFQAMLSTADQ